MQVLGKDNSVEVLLRQRGELGTDTMLCFCIPQKNILQLLSQRKLHDENQTLSQIIYAPIHLPKLLLCQQTQTLAKPTNTVSNVLSFLALSLQCNLNLCIWFDLWALHVYELTAECMCSVPSSTKTHEYVLKLCYIFHIQGPILFANSREGKRWRYGHEIKDWSEHTLRQG